MDEMTIFGGKVRKWALPTVQPGSGGNEPLLKRIVLPQGELAQFYDGEDGIRYIARIELKTGTVRGNHYHKIKREYVYIVSGEILLVVEEPGSKLRESVGLVTGDLIFIEPGVVHALQVTRSGDAVEFSPNKYNVADTYRVKLV